MGSASRLAVVIAASALLHVAPFASRAGHVRLTTVRGELARSMPKLDESALHASALRRRTFAYLGIDDPAEVPAARAKLVDVARAERAGGTLKLGTFLLRGAALDAFERGLPIDPERDQRAYDERVLELTYRLNRREEPTDIITLTSAVFGDLDYHGSGGSIADVLANGGGSCEGLTHLLASALHDAGLAQYTYVRRWGGGEVGHLAPIYATDSGIDLLSGEEPEGGVEFRAEELVEVYARHHALAPRLPASSAGTAKHETKLPSLAAGYPPNGDEYPGAVPLYAAKAIASVSAARSNRGASSGGSAGGDGDDRATRRAMRSWEFDACPIRRDGFLPSMTTLTLADGDVIDLGIEFIMTDKALSEVLRDVASREAEPPKSQAKLLVQHACRAFVYALAARQLSFRRKIQLSRDAAERSLAARREAVALAASMAWTDAEKDEFLGSEGIESVADIPELADRFLGLYDESRTPVHSIRRIPLVVELALDPRTQQRALGVIERRPIEERIRIVVDSDLISGKDRALPKDSTLAVAVAAARRFFSMRLLEDNSAEGIIAAIEQAGMPAAWMPDLREYIRREYKAPPRAD